MKFPHFHWTSWFSMDFIEFTRNPPYSAGMQKRQVIPMLFQWLQRSYSLPSTPKHDFLEIHEFLCNFLKFHEISRNFWNFTQIPVLRTPWSARLFNPCFSPRNIKVSWRVADGWKHKIPWVSLKIMKFQKVPWNFINSYISSSFHHFSALRRWHAKRTVIPMVSQWLQRAHSSPGTPKSDFSWKYWILTKIMGNFMEIGEI